MYPFIDFGFYKQPTYGLVLALALLLIYWRTWKTAPMFNLERENVANAFFWILLGGIIGGRLLYVIIEWKYFFEHPVEIIFSRTNLVFYGGFIGSLITGWFYTRKTKLNFFELADFFAPYLALGHAIGRVGCMLYGCCYGKMCHVPWGVRFPKWIEDGEVAGSPAYLDHLYQHLISRDDLWSLHIHPVQLYESLSLLLFFGLLMYIRKKTFFIGQTFLIYIFGYSIIRFTMEFFRGDFRGSWWGIVSTSQGISIIMFIAASILFFKLKSQKGRG